MEKRDETAFLGYFAVLFMLVVNSMITNMNIVKKRIDVKKFEK